MRSVLLAAALSFGLAASTLAPAPPALAQSRGAAAASTFVTGWYRPAAVPQSGPGQDLSGVALFVCQMGAGSRLQDCVALHQSNRGAGRRAYGTVLTLDVRAAAGGPVEAGAEVTLEVHLADLQAQGLYAYVKGRIGPGDPPFAPPPPPPAVVPWTDAAYPPTPAPPAISDPSAPAEPDITGLVLPTGRLAALPMRRDVVSAHFYGLDDQVRDGAVVRVTQLYVWGRPDAFNSHRVRFTVGWNAFDCDAGTYNEAGSKDYDESGVFLGVSGTRLTPKAVKPGSTMAVLMDTVCAKAKPKQVVVGYTAALAAAQADRDFSSRIPD